MYKLYNNKKIWNMDNDNIPYIIIVGNFLIIVGLD